MSSQNIRREINIKRVEHVVPMTDYGVSHEALSTAIDAATKEYQALTGGPGSPVAPEAVRVMPGQGEFVIWFAIEKRTEGGK